MLKKIRYLLEVLLVRLGLMFFALIGVKASSNLASKLAVFIGKKHKTSKLAFQNLGKAIPSLSDEEKKNIIEEMWDNLGRIIGEFYYIGKAKKEKFDEFVEVSAETKANFDDLKKLKTGGIVVSGHIGNWEIGPKFFLKNGIKVRTLYRPLNNPYVEKLTAEMREVELIEKGTSGSRKIVEAIKNGEFVIILADQKITEGEPVKFFHADATTATSIARIALKYNVPIIPARSIRLGKKFKFRVELEKPLAIQSSKDINFDVLRLTRQINEKLEGWIKEYPSQWFWVHDRWKK